MPKLKTRKTVAKKLKIKKTHIKRKKAHASHLMSKRRNVARRRAKGVRYEPFSITNIKRFLGKLIPKLK